MKALKTWKSPATGAVYPVRWRVIVQPLALEMEVVNLLEDQELALGPISYWEGAVDAMESKGAKRRIGKGYLELTGYAGPLRALRGGQ
jgi:predicted secreted hydrolase